VEKSHMEIRTLLFEESQDNSITVSVVEKIIEQMIKVIIL